MLVIRGDSTLAVGGAAVGRIHPIHRCYWEDDGYDATVGQYVISGAHFYDGNTAVLISNAVLGHIGNSGRFVPMTDS